jgi:microcystin-dependent protein
MNGTIGEIILFAGNFAPRTWAFCEGQLLPISSNTALFSILGTTYGGDGRTTFALPDLRGRTAIQPGRGPGLTDHRLGEIGGAETTTLTVATMPSHNHITDLKVSSANATLTAATAGSSIATPGSISARDFVATSGFGDAAPNVAMNGASVTIANSGNGQAFGNMQPYIAMNFVICLTGLYPSRS